MENRIWTVADLLRWTSGYLKDKGCDSPRLDAELLLAHALGCTRLELYTGPDRPLTRAELDKYRGLVRERAARRCVAHIIGEREFFRLRLHTPAGVFVPRPETELIVEQVLAATQPGERFVLLDLCTGSGNLVVSILSERPSAVGTAVDISPVAVRTASENARNAGVADRLSVVQAEAREYLAGATETFRFVTFNPPYVPSGEWDALEPEIRLHEPREAVDGGADGLDLVRVVVPMLERVLVAGGFFLMEYAGAGQTPEVRRLLAGAGFVDIVVFQDLAGDDRFVSARRPEAGE
jgi:release factor glutamine methyltransferase